MAQNLIDNSSLDQNSGPSRVQEVQVYGNVLSSDGKGKIMYDGVDGSHAEIFPDGSASYDGPEGPGVSGEMNPDGSGYWIASDGSTSSWDASEIPASNLAGMEGLSNMDSIANSPEAEEAFGKPVTVHGTGKELQVGLFQTIFLKYA